MSESNGKLRSLTIQEKIEIIEMVEHGKSIKDVSEQTGINRNSLHYILKSRNKIREGIIRNPTLTKHKRIKQTKNPKLEAEILNYIYKPHKGEKLTGSIIKAMALEMSIKMNIKDFRASNGWLFSFFKRNGLSMNDFNSKANESNPQSSMTIKNDDSENQEEAIYEIEETPNGDISECTEMIEIEKNQIDWNSWCKFCGSTDQTNVILQMDEAVFNMFNFICRFSLDNELRCCESCLISFEEASKFIMKTKNIDNMFSELEEEQNKCGKLTDEYVHSIRQKYLTSDENSCIIQEDHELCEDIQKDITDTIENDDIIYEEDYLEDEDMTKYEVQDNTNFEFIEEAICISKEETSGKSQDEENYVYNCHVCCKNFDRMCFLTNHTRQLHNCLPRVGCSCGKYLATWESLMAHKRKHSTEPADWMCEICNAKFQTKTGLSIHIKFKHDRKLSQIKFLCEICELTFDDATSLKIHNRTCHSQKDEKSPVECNICMKQLSNKYSLKAHITTVHEKQKTIFCHLCTKGFSNKSNLRSHLVSHTTEYISCNICNQIFKNRVSLQSHKKIHKPQESLKFACWYCDKRFHNRNHLERHMISHSSEKKFKCPFDGCDAAYKWEKDLKNHESIHNRGKNHQCEFCERFFTDLANLRKHKLRHHQDELSEYEKIYGKRRSIV